MILRQAEIVENTPFFAYGSLRYEKVMAALIGRIPRHENAAVENAVCLSIKGEVFPAMQLKEGGGTVTGTVWYGLTIDEINTLDQFEDKRYSVMVILTRNRVRVFSFVARHDTCFELGGKWSAQKFWKKHAEMYIAMCGRIRRQQSLSRPCYRVSCSS
jgi:hypothetical protein